MQVKNRNNGRVFETNRFFFESVIVAKGNGQKYDVIEDDAPLEVKKLRQTVTELRKKQSNPETTDETNKTNGE